MKKLLSLMMILVMVAAMAIPAAAAGTAEPIWFDDFSKADARNYKNDFYDTKVADGKLSIAPLEPTKYPLYQLPGTERMTGSTAFTMAITFTYTTYADQSILGFGFGGEDTENYLLAGISTAKVAKGAQRYWAHIHASNIIDPDETAAQGKTFYSRGYNNLLADEALTTPWVFTANQEYTLIVEVNGSALPEIAIYQGGTPVAFYHADPAAYWFDQDKGFTTDGIIGLVMSKAVALEIDALGIWTGVGLDRAALLGTLDGTIPAQTTAAPSETTAAPVETTAAPVTTAPAATPSTADGSLVLLVAAAGVLTVCILSARRRRT